jgi:hypothetical protein
MGLFDAVKQKLSTNLQLTRQSFMTGPQQIVAFCRGVDAASRSDMIRAIESQFKWQSVAQLAQAMFPAYGSGSHVSEEALDMVKGGQISGGLELMRMENQSFSTANPGMTPAQQAALTFAWIVLTGMEKRPG